MGLHVHVSLLRDLDYSRLMSFGFYRLFEGYALRLGCDAMEERFGGQYSASYSDAEDFIFSTYYQSMADAKEDVDRYRAINFCHRLHGTVEFRVFPATVTREQAMLYVEFLVDLIEY